MLVESGVKRCNGCNRDAVPIAEFRPRIKHGKVAIRSRCDSCERAASRQYRLDHLEICRARKDKHAAAHPEQVYKHRRARFFRSLGIDHTAGEKWYQAHNDSCAICGCTASEANTRISNLSIDHDHATNEIRGVVCARCNSALGLLDDDPEKLMRAATYLQTPRVNLPAPMPREQRTAAKAQESIALAERRELERTEAKNNPAKWIARGELNGHALMDDASVMYCRNEVVISKTSQTLLAERFNVSLEAINSIVHGRSWKHVGGPILGNGRRLTAKEKGDMQRMINEGLSNRNITTALGISRTTVDRHRKRGLGPECASKVA